MSSINKKEFFDLLSKEANYIGVDTATSVYYAMIKIISRQLRSRHSIKIPDLGEFKLTIRKSRRSRNPNTGEMMILPPIPEVRFTPDYKVKEYFQNYGKNVDLTK